MLKKIITFETYDGAIITEPYYFNLTKTEIMELRLTEKTLFGDDKVAAKIKTISEKDSETEVLKEDMKDLYDVFKDLIRVSYGVKSDDGKRIMKSEDYYRSFLESPAYDKLMMSFFEEPEVTIDFMAGLLPKEMGEEAKKTYNKESKNIKSVTSDLVPEPTLIEIEDKKGN